MQRNDCSTKEIMDPIIYFLASSLECAVLLEHEKSVMA